MAERFVGEAVTPDADTFDTKRMAAGEPGLPRRFVWRGETVEVTELLRAWKETGPCRHGSGERYVRRHWFEVRTATGVTVKLYFERQPRGGRNAPRWWLYTTNVS